MHRHSGPRTRPLYYDSNLTKILQMRKLVSVLVPLILVTATVWIQFRMSVD